MPFCGDWRPATSSAESEAFVISLHSLRPDSVQHLRVGSPFSGSYEWGILALSEIEENREAVGLPAIANR